MLLRQPFFQKKKKLYRNKLLKIGELERVYEVLDRKLLILFLMNNDLRFVVKCVEHKNEI